MYTVFYSIYSFLAHFYALIYLFGIMNQYLNHFSCCKRDSQLMRCRGHDCYKWQCCQQKKDTTQQPTGASRSYLTN